MFTGIIECLGKINRLEREVGNMHITIDAPIVQSLKIDQSIAHNGVCLTVVAIGENTYTVTAIAETLLKTNLEQYAVGDFINLERAMILGERLDGHLVQGHVDQTGTCVEIVETNGSWKFTFEYDDIYKNRTIEKGSITINGVSLTVFASKKNTFSVAIIPYTMEHTTFKFLKKGDFVNLEFDVIGKYVKAFTQNY